MGRDAGGRGLAERAPRERREARNLCEGVSDKTERCFLAGQE